MKNIWYNILKKLCTFLGKSIDMQLIPRPNIHGPKRKFRYVIMNDPRFGEPKTAISSSPQELINLLSMNLPDGQYVRILNELPPDSDTENYGKFNVNKTLESNSNPNWIASGDLAPGRMLQMDIPQDQLHALQSMHGQQATTPENLQHPISHDKPVKQTVHQNPQPSQQTEIRYFKIGNTECKVENGKVYQKQWMPVTDNEMVNYRLISDKNNKILSMDGKHLEMMKWVITEDNSNE